MITTMTEETGTKQVTPNQWLSPSSVKDTVVLNASEADWPNPSAGIPARYQILGQIGTGGMGIVYKVRDSETGEVVALKVLKPGIASDPEMQQNLRKEVCLARKVTHKNVCRIHEFNRSNGTACLSMEFVEGENLLSKLRRVGPLSLEESLNIGRQICAGLAEAHAQGIVHRDLKPANIMLDGSGVVKIMDFGIARVSQGNTQMTGTISGTPAYMAPEQVQFKSTGPRADIYALGLLLYEMVTGVPAFDGETPIAIALKQIQESPKKPSEIARSLPANIESAILKCLRKDPAKRFQSVDELCAALEEKTRATVDSHRMVSVQFQLPDLKMQRAVDYGVGIARAAVPVLATLAADLEHESLKAARFARHEVEKAWAFVRAQDLRQVKIDRRGSSAAALAVVLLVAAFGYGSHPRQKKHAADVAAQSSAAENIQSSHPSDSKTTADGNSLTTRSSSSLLAAIPPGGDDQTVSTAEVDLSESSNSVPGAESRASSAVPLGSVTSSRPTSTAAVEEPKAKLNSARPIPPPVRTNAAQSKIPTARLTGAHVPKPALAAVSEMQAADSSMNGLTAVGARPDLSAALLPAATPEPAKPAGIDKQKAAGSQPDVTENYLEVASFNDSTWSDKAVDQLTQLGFHAVTIHKSHLWMQSFHVRVGPYANIPDMEAAEKSLAKLGFKSHPAR